MKPHRHRWEPIRRGYPQRICRCGALKALHILAGENSITSSPAGVGDVVRWSATKAAVAAGDLGMDTTTGRPSVFVGGTARSLSTTVDSGTQTYGFGNTIAVPAGGTLQLQGPGTSLVGVDLLRSGTITAASISVDAADGVRSYDLDIRIGGVSVTTVALAIGNTGARSTALSVNVAAGDVLTAFMVRTAGAGASTFSEELAVVEVRYS